MTDFLLNEKHILMNISQRFQETKSIKDDIFWFCDPDLFKLNRFIIQRYTAVDFIYMSNIWDEFENQCRSIILKKVMPLKNNNYMEIILHLF